MMLMIKKRQLFVNKEIVDPKTGKKRIISAQEQEEALEKGILLFPIKKGENGVR